MFGCGGTVTVVILLCCLLFLCFSSSSSSSSFVNLSQCIVYEFFWSRLLVCCCCVVLLLCFCLQQVKNPASILKWKNMLVYFLLFYLHFVLLSSLSFVVIMFLLCVTKYVFVVCNKTMTTHATN